MSKLPFSKPALTYEQQLKQLIDRGLDVEDQQRAIHLLESISYYRLSGYWYPLLDDKVNHIFKNEAKFDNAFDMYSFDRALRVLIIRELEKIEISIRAKMIYILSHEYSPFWYSEGHLYTNEQKHSGTLEKLSNEYQRSKEEFIIEFRKKYNDPFPPSWIMLEISSFGSLSNLYSNLINQAPKNIVANYFGLAPKVLESWMHSIVYIRNICAHHSRLWNKSLHISPVIPRRTRKTWLKNQEVENNRVYYILSILLYLLQTINPQNTFAKRLKALSEKYQNIDLHAMGFPINWEEEPLWK